MAFTLGVEELRSKTFDSTALPSFSHEKTTPYGALSMTSKSRTLKMGDSMAHCSAAPRDTHSLAFRVRLGSFWKVSMSFAITKGTRELPPTSSTLLIWSSLTPASATACSMVFTMRGPRDEQSSSNCSLLMAPLASTSFCRLSTKMVASVLPLSTFFSFSHARRSRKLERGLLLMSSLYLASNSFTKCSNSTSSKSRPPRLRSHAWDSTSSRPFLNDTTLTWSEEWPMSTKATTTGLSSGRSVL
mmetsp:Transcript_1081/g.3293  ORF Transcript_1081/g.3293 Transcript_1081/m.3293 type:complete len:244 (-) Transcript_1081:752-1483(-)